MMASFTKKSAAFGARCVLAMSFGLTLPQAHAAPVNQPAINDAAATFSNGLFLLPDLKSAKDSYVVVITPDGGGEPTRITLPAGVTGIRVSDKAMPTGAWKWAYKVTLDEPPAFKLVTATELHLLPNDVPMTGKVLVQWEPVAGAAKYSITGKSLAPQGSDLPPKESKLDASCFAKTCLSNGVPTIGLEAAPGADITWRVTALDSDGIALARSPEAHIAVDKTVVQDAKDRGWSVKQSDTLSKLTASDPAKFSYTSSTKGSAPRTSAYQAQFAVIYDAPQSWNDFYPRASLEAHLTSSGEDKAKDALIFRAGGYKLIWTNPAQAEGTEWVSNFKYETERKTGTKKSLVELGFTPVYGALGQYAGPSAFRVAPSVSFGTEVGKTFDVGSSEEKKDTIVRLRTTARLDAQFLTLSRFLGFRSVSAFIQASYWRLPREDDQKNFRFGATGLSVGLTDFLSLDLEYSAGRKAPLFTFERTGTVGLGLKF